MKRLSMRNQTAVERNEVAQVAGWKQPCQAPATSGECAKSSVSVSPQLVFAIRTDGKDIHYEFASRNSVHRRSSSGRPVSPILIFEYPFRRTTSRHQSNASGAPRDGNQERSRCREKCRFAMPHNPPRHSRAAGLKAPNRTAVQREVAVFAVASKPTEARHKQLAVRRR